MTSNLVLPEPAREVGVLVVDDHPIFRQGIWHMLEYEEGICPLGEADSIERALDWLASHRADVVLLDHNLPGTNGVDGLPQLLAAQRDLQVIVLTVCDRDDVMLDAVRAGACGYVLKDAPPERLVEAIQAAAAGECRVSDRMVRSLFRQVGRPGKAGPFHGPGEDGVEVGPVPDLSSATPREREILGCLVRGLSNKEIAKDLGLSPHTIRNQIQRMLERFDAHNRVQLALLAKDGGLA